MDMPGSPTVESKLNSVEETESKIHDIIEKENTAVLARFRRREGPAFSPDVMTLRVFAPTRTDFPGICITDTPGLTITNMVELRAILRDLLLVPVVPQPAAVAGRGSAVTAQQYRVRDFVIPVWVNRWKENVTAEGTEVDFWATEHVPAMYADWRTNSLLSDGEVQSLVKCTQVVVSAMDTRFSAEFRKRGTVEAPTMSTPEDVATFLAARKVTAEEIAEGCARINEVLSDEYCKRGRCEQLPLPGAEVAVTWKPYLGTINHVGAQQDFTEARAIEQFIRDRAGGLSEQARARLGQEQVQAAIGMQYGLMLLRWAARVKERGVQTRLLQGVNSIQVYEAPVETRERFSEIWNCIVRAVDAVFTKRIAELMESVADAYTEAAPTARIAFPADQLEALADEVYELLCTHPDFRARFRLDRSVNYAVPTLPSKRLDRFPNLRQYLWAVFVLVLCPETAITRGVQDQVLISAAPEALAKQCRVVVSGALASENDFCGELVKLQALVRRQRFEASEASQVHLKHLIAARLTGFTAHGKAVPPGSLGSVAVEALHQFIMYPVGTGATDDSYRTGICGTSRGLCESQEWRDRRAHNKTLLDEVLSFNEELAAAASRAASLPPV